MATWTEENHYLPKKKKFTTNPLLKKSRVGRTKGASDPLPPESFVYGRPGSTGEPTAAEVMHDWQMHMPNKEAIASRDFVRTNKEAAAVGCTDVKMNAAFRTSRMYRQRKGPVRNKSEEVFHDKLNNMTFGMKNETGTPIDRVVTNEFHRKWVNKQKHVLRAPPRTRSQASSIPAFTRRRKSGDATRGTRQEPLFKMKQFAEVKSRVEIPKPDWYKPRARTDRRGLEASSEPGNSTGESAAAAADEQQEGATAAEELRQVAP